MKRDVVRKISYYLMKDESDVLEMELEDIIQVSIKSYFE